MPRLSNADDALKAETKRKKRTLTARRANLNRHATAAAAKKARDKAAAAKAAAEKKAAAKVIATASMTDMTTKAI